MHCILHRYQTSMRYLNNIEKYPMAPTQAEEVGILLDAQRKAHQIKLANEKQQDSLDLYPNTEMTTGNEKVGVVNRSHQTNLLPRIESYKRESQIPPNVRDLAVIVDVEAWTVILPIMGRPVPFHLSTIRNANTTNDFSCTDKKGIVYLRINFCFPGRTGQSQKYNAESFQEPKANFLTSITLSSGERDRMEFLAWQITELRKDYVQKEQEKKNLVDARKLIEVPSMFKLPTPGWLLGLLTLMDSDRRPHRLYIVFAQPAIPNLVGPRMPGELELHQNGVRFCDPRDSSIDILFSNVKHLIYQPSDERGIVLIHLHLKMPILIGKKRFKEVQFYRKVPDARFVEMESQGRKRRRLGDWSCPWSNNTHAEFGTEGSKRKKIHTINTRYKLFADKIQNAGREHIHAVDVPFREFSFYGVTHRFPVLCQPTARCLFQLTDTPFMVLTLEDVEIVYFEGVHNNMVNFDMVWVFKDFHRSTLQIRSIGAKSLEYIKNWLDMASIVFYQGSSNLNWENIMENIVQDTYGFFAGGGWSFLSKECDDRDEMDDDDASSTFEMSIQELYMDRSSSDEST